MPQVWVDVSWMSVWVAVSWMSVWVNVSWMSVWVDVSWMSVWVDVSWMSVWVNVSWMSVWVDVSWMSVWVDVSWMSVWVEVSWMSVWVDVSWMSVWVAVSWMSVWIDAHDETLHAMRTPSADQWDTLLVTLHLYLFELVLSCVCFHTEWNYSIKCVHISLVYIKHNLLVLCPFLCMQSECMIICWSHEMIKFYRYFSLTLTYHGQ